MQTDLAPQCLSLFPPWKLSRTEVCDVERVCACVRVCTCARLLTCLFCSRHLQCFLVSQLSQVSCSIQSKRPQAALDGRTNTRSRSAVCVCVCLHVFASEWRVERALLSPAQLWRLSLFSFALNSLVLLTFFSPLSPLSSPFPACLFSYTGFFHTKRTTSLTLLFFSFFSSYL